MKKRARIVSGLAALAALFLAPIAQASLTRSNTPAREAPALALTLAAPELSEFSLFDGTEIARALASRPALISISTDEEQTAVRTRFVSPSELSADELPDGPELVPITGVREQPFNLQLSPGVFGLEPLRGPPGDEASYPKTRYRVFGLLGTPILGELRGVSLELHWRSASFSCGFASGTVGWLSEDPAADADSPNAYAFVGWGPHEATDPMGLSSYDPAAVGHVIRGFFKPIRGHANDLWNRLPSQARAGYELLHQQDPLAFPTPDSALSMGEETLAKPFEIAERTGTLIGEGASWLEIAASIGDDVSTTIFSALPIASAGGAAIERGFATASERLWGGAFDNAWGGLSEGASEWMAEEASSFVVPRGAAPLRGGLISGIRNPGAFSGMSVAGKTPSGMPRVTAVWRAKYGPSAPRRHHLGPQELLNDPDFRLRMREMGFGSRSEMRAYLDRQIADITNYEHIRIHAEGWNSTWSAWMRSNPQFTLRDMQSQIRSMMREFGIPASSRGGPRFRR